MNNIKDFEKAFKRLGREYRKSVKLIRKRIQQLKIELEVLEFEKGPRKNSDIPLEIQILKERLKALQEIYRTTSEIGVEAGNYYKRGWWRSEKYTTNSRKSRLPILYHGFIIEDA
ncbi:hypothetical protein HNQ80_005189, partial [Anaerosolibacter carboniphilus]